jgi:hypothetical protein
MQPNSARRIQPLSEDDNSGAVIQDALKRLAMVQAVTAAALLIFIVLLIAGRLVK